MNTLAPLLVAFFLSLFDARADSYLAQIKPEEAGPADHPQQSDCWINQSCTIVPMCTSPNDGLSEVMISSVRGLVSIEEIHQNFKFVNCNEKFAPILPEDSPNRTKFQELIIKGPEKITLQDLLILWYPEFKAESARIPYFFSCQKEPWGKIVGGDDTWLSKRCSPDVLYSWGPIEKLQTIQNRLRDGQRWVGSPNPRAEALTGVLFTSLSAASTFNYGQIPIRIKVKPQVVFKKTEWGASQRVVAYRDGQFQDFAISDSSVIESWSYATPELYDEIVRDILRITSGKRAVSYNIGEPVKSKGIDRLLSKCADTHIHSCDSTRLKRQLFKMAEMILNGEGRVYYADGSCRNRKRHYETLKPTYINPRKVTE